MKGDIIIHIGLHKTGTSFLQRVIFPKLDGVYYIRTNKAFEILSIRAIENKITLLSHEILSGKPGSIGRKDFRFELADSLKKLFPNAKIIIGIGELEPWLKSLHKQSIL